MILRQSLVAGCALLMSASTIAAAQPSVGPVQIAVEAFADEPYFTGPRLSPDGRFIAARETVDGHTHIIVTAGEGEAPIVRRIDAGSAEISTFDWIDNDRILITFAKDRTIANMAARIVKFSVVTPFAATGSAPVDKTGELLSGKLLMLDPAGRWMIVSAQANVYHYPEVFRVDLATNRAVRLETERTGIWDWYADDGGVIRAGIGYTGTSWTMWYRASAGEPLRKTGGKRSADGNGAVDALLFRKGSSDGVILTNERTGRFAAYRYDYETSTLGDALYEHPEVDIDSLATNPVSGGIDGVNYTDDRFHTVWLDPAMQMTQSRIDKALPDAENIILHAARDSNRLILWSGRADLPGAYYLFDRDSGKLTLLAQPFARLAKVTLAPVRPIRFEARDGLSIHGYLTLPQGRAAKNLPLIVMPHGGPHVRTTWDYDPYVQFLASRGYAVLQPNFRGSTGYGRAFVEKGYGQWGRAMQDDVDDGVDWLVKSGQVDAKRVCIMGASYGGYAALWGAIRNPDRYRCAVSLAGVTDLPDMLRFDRKTFSAVRYFRAWQAKVKGENAIDLDAVSPLIQASRLKIPVLIAHGEKDDNVPVRQGRRMVTALTAAKAPVESVFYPKAGHGLQSPADIVDFLTRLEKFLAKNNPS